MNGYAVFLGLAILATIGALVSYEILLCRLYLNNPIDWARAGSPTTFCGPYNTLPGFASSVARWRLGTKWALGTPEWMKRDRFAYRLLIFHRSCGAVVVATFVIFPIVALLLS